MHVNTNADQDRQIEAARQENHVDNLIAIISDLDQRLNWWREAAGLLGCDTPDELRSRINELPNT